MRRINKTKKGFTLIELLVVILILAILAALIVPGMMGHADDAKRAKARTDVMEIEGALKRYRLDNDHYPTAEEGLAALSSPPSGATNWHGPYLEHLSNDPWQMPYVYEPSGDDTTTPLVKSYGPDKAEGGSGDGAQDISNKDGDAQGG